MYKPNVSTHEIAAEAGGPSFHPLQQFAPVLTLPRLRPSLVAERKAYFI